MKPFLLLCVYVCLLTGCCVVGSNIEILSDRDWRMNSWTVSPAFLGKTDLFAQLPPCKQDDITKLRDEGILFYDEGPTKCQDTDPQKITSAWSMNEEQTEITFYTDTAIILLKVKKVTCDKLQMESSFEVDIDSTGVLSTFTYQFTYESI